MLVTVFQTGWVMNVPAEAIGADPTRMAQGIMTGIAFLGAGVIFKESPTVRGLTTAASIWVTAAIGILVGHRILRFSDCGSCRHADRAVWFARSKNTCRANFMSITRSSSNAKT